MYPCHMKLTFDGCPGGSRQQWTHQQEDAIGKGEGIVPHNSRCNEFNGG